MHPILKNILALLLGIVLGSVVNMLTVKLGHVIFPIDGVDPNNLEELARVMPDLGPKYFLFPFLAHALGTLVATFVVCRLAASRIKLWAGVIGGFFLAGGITASTLIPAPTWFICTDLLLAYIPMAWLGYKKWAPSRA